MLFRFARTVNPTMTDESQKVMVECYRKLRQGDTLGRSRTAYRITVRQLESLVRLSEALARLHCDDIVRPAYVRESFRLLRKSIIHVETEDVTFEDEFDDHDFDRGEDDVEAEDTNDNTEETETEERLQYHAGEYNPEEKEEVEGGPLVNESKEEEGVQEPPKKKQKKGKKKKTQITFEQYEAISNAISTYLRSNENETEEESTYLTWGEIVEWYLLQCETQIGDSMEELRRLRKLTNLVIRRLITIDHVLIYIGGDGAAESMKEEDRKIAVHPNYVV